MHRETKHVRIMTGNVLRKPSAKTAPYWGMLRGLSTPMKLELLVLLSESMEENAANTTSEVELTEEDKDRLFDSLCGCWTTDPEDGARMEAAVKECREHDVLREVKLDD